VSFSDKPAKVVHSTFSVRWPRSSRSRSARWPCRHGSVLQGEPTRYDRAARESSRRRARRTVLPCAAPRVAGRL